MFTINHTGAYFLIREGWGHSIVEYHSNQKVKEAMTMAKFEEKSKPIVVKNIWNTHSSKREAILWKNSFGHH